MTTLPRVLLVALMFSATASADPAPLSAGAQQVVALLKEFIAGAGGRDPALYDRFFADDVVYTRSTGAFTTKPMIMDNVRKPSNEPGTHFSAEDLTVRDFGDMVVVAFRLVGKTPHDGQVDTLLARDTGTFLKRNGRWQVVAWQATRIEEPASPK